VGGIPNHGQVARSCQQWMSEHTLGDGEPSLCAGRTLALHPCVSEHVCSCECTCVRVRAAACAIDRPIESRGWSGPSFPITVEAFGKPSHWPAWHN
jgi:hypothetical protein